MEVTSISELRKELDTRLSAYVPAIVRQHLEKKTNCIIPDTQETIVVSMFADVSGFTAMTESLAARGPVGAETLSKHLNSYFEQLLKLVSSAGGDVFKFAGDAMLIFWTENKHDSLETLLRRCLQCALRIQLFLHQAELAPGVILSVKMGIGIGGATIAHLGGRSDGSTSRIEYIAVGPALEQAFSAEHNAQAGDVICSSECWDIAKQYFTGEVLGNQTIGHESELAMSKSHYYKVTNVHAPIKLVSRRVSFTRDDPQLHLRIKQYVSRAVWPYLDAHDELWGSELREVTVLFINLGFGENDLAKMLDVKGPILQRLQSAFEVVQKCIFEYEGTINKFLVDDKGSTVIAAFGLPPVTHENDPIRGILSSLAICASLSKLDLKASVGITTGVAFCGVVGHQGNRREYTVLGDIVNLSARLMQKAKSEKGGVITDEATKLLAHDILHFEERPEIMVKGKNDSIKIHRPYPRMSILLAFHLSSQPNTLQSAIPKIHKNARQHGTTIQTTKIPNLMDNMHRVQVRDAQQRLFHKTKQVHIDQNALVKSEEFDNIEKKILHRCRQLSRVSTGGSLVLKGDIGLGKTVLLRSAIKQLDPTKYSTYYVCGSPFATRKSYAIWVDILMQAASRKWEQRNNTSSHHDESEVKLQQNLLQCTVEKQKDQKQHLAAFTLQLIQKSLPPNSAIEKHLNVLDEIFDVSFNQMLISRRKSVKIMHTDQKLQSKNYKHNYISSRHAHRSHSIKLQCSLSNSNDNQIENALNEVKLRNKSFGVYQYREMKELFEQDNLNKSGSSATEAELVHWLLQLLGVNCSEEKYETKQTDGEQNNNLSETLFTCNEPEDDDLNGANVKGDSRGNISTTDLPQEEFLMQNHQRESEWDPEELDLRGALLLCALHTLSRGRSTIFCLDDAMYMDEKSWVLATLISQNFTNCMVAIGTRPPSLAKTENTESSSYRKQLRAIMQVRPSTNLTMEPLSGDQIKQLACQKLNVNVIPDELADILISRTQGNPLFLHEIISEMLQQQVIQVDLCHKTCRLQVQEPWCDKSGAHGCFYCHHKFAGNKDKCRCKSCGYVFCANCTPKACYKKIPGPTADAVRHCRECFATSSTRRACVVPPTTASSSSASTVSSVSTASRHKSRMRALFASDSQQPTHSANLKSQLALRPPRAVRCVLTTLLDQLTTSQRMLMKTASIIGPVFEEELLRKSCPIKAHANKFNLDIQELERLCMIRRIETFIGGMPRSLNSSADHIPITRSPVKSNRRCKQAFDSQTQIVTQQGALKVKFEFNHGFMQDVIRSQMLSSQLDKLNTRISELLEQQQKEFRQRFFEKAMGSWNATIPVALKVSDSNDNASHCKVVQPLGGLRGLYRLPKIPPISTKDEKSHEPQIQKSPYKENNRPFLHTSEEFDIERSGASDDSLNSLEDFQLQLVDQDTPTSSQTDNETICVSYPSPLKSPMLKTIPTFTRLKTGNVVVKKHSSVFTHFKRLRENQLWKKRYAVLQTSRLLLQYDENHGSQPRQGSSLFLKGAKVNICDPEIATKINCFQLEVNEWTKGKYLLNQPRIFVIGVDNEAEVENWVYLIRYAIESLGNA